MSKADGDVLREAIRCYSFPAVTYDFVQGYKRVHESILGVEDHIREQLTCSKLEAVKNALSNVLYWGYARTGYRDVRVKDFRDKVTDDQLAQALDLFRSLSRPGANVSGLRSIAELKLPQFSGMSFVSKIRMFLDPWHFAVLDRKLLSLRTASQPTVFRRLSVGPSEIMIRISRHNEQVYQEWSDQCRQLSEMHLPQPRAVDAERAIFQLIDTGRSELAVQILQDVD